MEEDGVKLNTYECLLKNTYVGAHSHHMKQVDKNSIVTVSMIGTLDNEAIFETIDSTDPLIIELGEEGTPKPIQRILIGMQVGEVRRVHLKSEDGIYGIRRSDLLQEITNDQFTDKIEAKVGLVLSMNVDSDGVTHQIPATIVELKEDTIIIDYNHPLAGHPLNYEITVLEIQ